MNHQNIKPKESWRNIPAAAPLLRPSEVSRQTGLSRSTLYELIIAKEFPPFIKIGSRASAMPKVWLDAFIESRAIEALGAKADG